MENELSLSKEGFSPKGNGCSTTDQGFSFTENGLSVTNQGLSVTDLRTSINNKATPERKDHANSSDFVFFPSLDGEFGKFFPWSEIIFPCLACFLPLSAAKE